MDVYCSQRVGKALMKTNQEDEMKIEARNHRMLPPGMNWPGFQCDIYVDGQHACHVRDEGDGGMLLYTKEAPALMRALRDHAAAHPQIDGLDCTVDTLVALAVDDVEAEKQLRRDCKRMVLFRLPNDPPQEWRGYKCSFTAQIAALLRMKFGTVEIANERYA